ncbi:NADH:flavin oxidoreductase [Neptuniibacter sp. QD29_5]|uniref:NADH:flavin oxidoreductase n=1 Tax=Neptuniibacter sp. QD29_5 TaxID=3398207 RepID=UPI0039F5E5F3
MTTTKEILFKPSKLGKLEASNKLAVAPMTRVSANEDGTVGPLMKEYYEGYADGGFGLIITEGLYTDKLYSQGYRKQPGISSVKQANSWRPIVESVQQKGAIIIAQLMHAGALSQYNPFANTAMAPSEVQPLGEQMPFYYGDGPYRLPKSLTTSDIKEVVEGFVSSSLLAKQAGFNGVEIHGANGYLLDQFLTQYTNLRTDEYGGVLVNRLRIFKEVIKSVRQSVGKDFIVGMRLSQKKVNDLDYEWPEGESAAETTFKLMRECGVDYIHTTEPVLSEPAFEGSASLASLAKRISGLPIIANGGVVEPQLAINVIGNGNADFVSIGKAALANQDWPNLVKRSEDTNMFDFAMLAPIADLENSKRYLKNM